MSPRILFRTFATAEVITWAGLIIALIMRATGVADFVGIAGGVHGFVFLSYGVVTVFVWVNQKWRPSVGILGLISAVIPFATLPFEFVADRSELLGGTWRLAEGGETPNGFVEQVQAWVLRHLTLSIVMLLCGVTLVFVLLLLLGSPIPQS
jgi:integral membrane protein